MDWRQHITVDPAICHGRACVKGTRVTVSVILEHLAAGHATEEIVEDFPSHRHGSILAALSYVADVVRADRLLLPAGDA